MALTFVDLVLAILVLGFVIFGFYYGLLHTVGSLLGTIVALIITGYLSPFIVSWIDPFVSVGPVFRTIIFIVLFFVVFRIVGFFFWIVEKTVGVIAKLPFISSIDKLLGIILGFVEGVFVAGILVHVIIRYFDQGSLFDALVNSSIAQWIVDWTGWAIAWLPF